MGFTATLQAGLQVYHILRMFHSLPQLVATHQLYQLTLPFEVNTHLNRLPGVIRTMDTLLHQKHKAKQSWLRNTCHTGHTHTPIPGLVLLLLAVFLHNQWRRVPQKSHLRLNPPKRPTHHLYEHQPFRLTKTLGVLDLDRSIHMGFTHIHPRLCSILTVIWIPLLYPHGHKRR